MNKENIKIKIVALLILSILLMSLFISCGDNNNTETENEDEEEVKSFVNGVSDDEIILGMSAPLGESQLSFIGNELLKGAMSYFNEVNENGGVHGRKIKVKSYDDAYVANQCFNNTNKLINKDRVFALFNYAGSQPTVQSLSLVDNYKIPLFGVASGDETFRKFNKEYIVNVRPSTKQEVKVMINYLVEEMNLKRFSVFYQKDAYGETKLRYAEDALKSHDIEIVSKGTCDPDSMNIEIGLVDALKNDPEVVLVFAFTLQGGFFINEAKKKNPELYFYSVSSGYETVDQVKTSIGSTEAQRDRVFISQPFPSPWASGSELLKEYHNLLLKYYPESLLNYYNMEGFVNAIAIVKTLELTGKDLTRESFLETVRNMKNEETYGIRLMYGEDDNQGMFQVFISTIRNGIFEDVN